MRKSAHPSKIPNENEVGSRPSARGPLTLREQIVCWRSSSYRAFGSRAVRERAHAGHHAYGHHRRGSGSVRGGSSRCDVLGKRCWM